MSNFRHFTITVVGNEIQIDIHSQSPLSACFLQVMERGDDTFVLQVDYTIRGMSHRAYQLLDGRSPSVMHWTISEKKDIVSRQPLSTQMWHIKNDV